MKPKLLPEFHKKFHQHDKMYGTTTIGTKGQVVIPAEARKDLHLQPGDKLMVMGHMNKALGLIKTEAMDELIQMVMKHVTGTDMEDVFKKHVTKMFGKAAFDESRRGLKNNDT